MLIVSEAPPGPPWVITKITSNVLSESIKRNSTAVTIVGRSSGSVISQSICALLAPSITAASYGSCGKAARPARQISMISGVHCQVSTITSAGITVLDEYVQVQGGSPTTVKK